LTDFVSERTSNLVVICPLQHFYYMHFKQDNSWSLQAYQENNRYQTAEATTTF